MTKRKAAGNEGKEPSKKTRTATALVHHPLMEKLVAEHKISIKPATFTPDNAFLESLKKSYDHMPPFQAPSPYNPFDPAEFEAKFKGLEEDGKKNILDVKADEIYLDEHNKLIMRYNFYTRSNVWQVRNLVMPSLQRIQGDAALLDDIAEHWKFWKINAISKPVSYVADNDTDLSQTIAVGSCTPKMYTVHAHAETGITWPNIDLTKPYVTSYRPTVSIFDKSNPTYQATTGSCTLMELLVVGEQKKKTFVSPGFIAPTTAAFGVCTDTVDGNIAAKLDILGVKQQRGIWQWCTGDMVSGGILQSQIIDSGGLKYSASTKEQILIQNRHRNAFTSETVTPSVEEWFELKEHEGEIYFPGTQGGVLYTMCSSGGKNQLDSQHLVLHTVWVEAELREMHLAEMEKKYLEQFARANIKFQLQGGNKDQYWPVFDPFDNRVVPENPRMYKLIYGYPVTQMFEPMNLHIQNHLPYQGWERCFLGEELLEVNPCLPCERCEDKYDFDDPKCQNALRECGKPPTSRNMPCPGPYCRHGEEEVHNMQRPDEMLLHHDYLTFRKDETVRQHKEMQGRYEHLQKCRELYLQGYKTNAVDVNLINNVARLNDVVSVATPGGEGVTSFLGLTGDISSESLKDKLVMSVNGKQGVVSVMSGVKSFLGMQGDISEANLKSKLVTSVNAQKGDVTVGTGTSGVQSFLGMHGEITLNQVKDKLVTSVNTHKGDVTIATGASGVKSFMGLTGDITETNVQDKLVTSVNNHKGDVSIDGGVTTFLGLKGAITHGDLRDKLVTSVNNQKGDVTAQGGVTSFLGLQGNIDEAQIKTRLVTAVNNQKGDVSVSSGTHRDSLERLNALGPWDGFFYVKRDEPPLYSTILEDKEAEAKGYRVYGRGQDTVLFGPYYLYKNKLASYDSERMMHGGPDKTPNFTRDALSKDEIYTLKGRGFKGTLKYESTFTPTLAGTVKATVDGKTYTAEQKHCDIYPPVLGFQDPYVWGGGMAPYVPMRFGMDRNFQFVFTKKPIRDKLGPDFLEPKSATSYYWQTKAYTQRDNFYWLHMNADNKACGDATGIRTEGWSGFGGQVGPPVNIAAVDTFEEHVNFFQHLHSSHKGGTNQFVGYTYQGGQPHFGCAGGQRQAHEDNTNYNIHMTFVVPHDFAQRLEMMHKGAGGIAHVGPNKVGETVTRVWQYPFGMDNYVWHYPKKIGDFLSVGRAVASNREDVHIEARTVQFVQEVRGQVILRQKSRLIVVLPGTKLEIGDDDNAFGGFPDYFWRSTVDPKTHAAVTAYENDGFKVNKVHSITVIAQGHSKESYVMVDGFTYKFKTAPTNSTSKAQMWFGTGKKGDVHTSKSLALETDFNKTFVGVMYAIGVSGKAFKQKMSEHANNQVKVEATLRQLHADIATEIGEHQQHDPFSRIGPCKARWGGSSGNLRNVYPWEVSSRVRSMEKQRPGWLIEDGKTLGWAKWEAGPNRMVPPREYAKLFPDIYP